MSFDAPLKSPEEIRYLQIEKGEIYFEKEPASLSYPDDFDIQLLAEFAETARESKGWSQDHSKESILELMHL